MLNGSKFRNSLRVLASLSITAGALLFAATPASAKIRVVTTLPSFADIAQSVGGDEVSATALSRGNQDPHFVDAKPDLMLDLNKADLLIRAGLGLEDGWLPPLQTGSRNGKIQTGSEGNLDCSTLVELREVPKGALDRSEGDVHPGGNPHFMLDPRNGALIAKGIAERLAKLEPTKTDYFRANAKTYSDALAKKVTEWSKALLPLKGRPIVTYHKSWVYFSAFAGLDEVGYVEPKPGVPPSPEHTIRLINLIKAKQAKLILMETYYPKGVAESVAQETGAKLLVLPTEVNASADSKTYVAIFDAIVAQLKGK